MRFQPDTMTDRVLREKEQSGLLVWAEENSKNMPQAKISKIFSKFLLKRKKMLST